MTGGVMALSLRETRQTTPPWPTMSGAMQRLANASRLLARCSVATARDWCATSVRERLDLLCAPGRAWTNRALSPPSGSNDGLGRCPPPALPACRSFLRQMHLAARWLVY